MTEVRELSFSYGEEAVLDGISFEAGAGEMICILGRNGAGKTTLFKCMLGILKGYSGSVRYDGREVSELSTAEKAGHVAYIPQASNPTFAYSVRDMVLMGTTARLAGRMRPGADERRTADAAMEKMGIIHLADRSYAKISGGEQQMVLIARALAQGAKTLVMDEPTSSLDYGNRMKVQLHMSGLRDAGYTIIQSTHDPEQAYMFADKVICIRNGRIHSQGDPRLVLDENLIRDLYGIDVDVITSRDGRARSFIIK